MVPITFAHRGARLEEPENTLAAFRRALAQGSTGLETDAWLSADGEVVLTHDPVVRRGLKRYRVAAAPVAELDAIGVPRLADLYAELGADFELSVDLKVPEAALPLLEVARAAGALERLWLCSPDVDLLCLLRAEEPSPRLVHSERRKAITVPLERHAANLASAGVDVMNLHHSEWTAGLVALFHRFGRRAFAWDAQEVRQIRTVLAMGVDGVYCDRPDRLVATVAQWTS